MFETRLLSSLSKVFADEELQDAAVKTGSCLRGEVYSFQVAYRSQELVKGIEVGVASSLARHIEVRTVGLVPAEFLGARFDDDWDDEDAELEASLEEERIAEARKKVLADPLTYRRSLRLAATRVPN